MEIALSRDSNPILFHEDIEKIMEKYTISTNRNYIFKAKAIKL